ncbi:alpha/beta-hydrolase [Thozetella sp. PMI_491]|nr:alpha/beta-hydrolase [Thozetella sp. PMI_491]
MASSSATAGTRQLPTVAETMKHPAFPTAVWNLTPDQEGFLPVADGRGGPFRISWEIHGTGPVKVVFIMGLGAIKSAWQRQVLHFGHERHDRYSVLILDNRGMGDSDKPLMRYSSSEMARDIAEVLTHVGWAAPAGEPQTRQVHIVGLSLGGMIAQELAYLIPDAVSSLNLCCTAAAIENTTTFTENMANRASLLIPKSVENSVRGAARNMFPEPFLYTPDDTHLPDPETTRNVLPPAPGTKYLRFDCQYERFVAQEMHKRLDPAHFGLKGFLLQLIAAGWHRKSPEQLKELGDKVGRERILVMHGTVDGMISPPHGKKLIDYVKPDVGLIVEGMGHVPMIERSTWYNKLLEERFAVGEKLDGRN